ncbi:hypothetical protein Zmor_023200 [Zophobas morio]|uniref:Phosphatidylinositol N-acetylglucosaminyltransferase subunit Q n=1 Tax=Zophobas morio TaxID=2755281 RepID=A0AA38HXE3_9CUCU|nr:hypothetical protein Zmor_023200 [Zophobas morio]
MVKNILVFVPNSLHLNKTGYLEGVRNESDECAAYYITNDAPLKEKSNNVVGYLSNDVTRVKRDSRTLHIDNATSKITLINYSNPNVVRIVYDFKAFRDCDELNPEVQYGVHFKFLSCNVRKRRRVSDENGRKSLAFRLLLFFNVLLEGLVTVFNKTKPLWGYSATVTHFRDNLESYKWFIEQLLKEKRLTPKSGNLLFSKIFDLVLGVLLLRFFLEHEDFIVRFIENVRENIIHNFRDLLIYLMGSPIGLKLNYAFNKSLGTFFFYHISLWRVFLITMQPFLKEYFRFLVLPAVFGFSYQIAMLSDLISIATFHVYCIYVYAARLIYFQLKGLLSLWRLFIGRKYNPLRTRVDSYQYSQHQLFIGTLGFTVLLFLLPTTAMYYAVFVTFRLVILIVEEILTKIRYVLQCLPIYVFILFLASSPHMAGPICLKSKKSKDGIPTFEAHLKMLPLLKSIKTFAPEVANPAPSLSLGKIFTGVLL